jgi:hypothetical protein
VAGGTLPVNGMQGSVESFLTLTCVIMSLESSTPTSMCADPSRNGSERIELIRGLTQVRCVAAVPQLINLLETHDGWEKKETLKALKILTKQRFGKDVAAWRAWSCTEG